MTDASDAPAYEVLGVGYRAVRATDPRLAVQLAAALGPVDTVLNVGAGTGSYESVAPRLIAVEPSPTMLWQRPPSAAPAVRAVAEALPFPDTCFDAAMAILTIHHWRDLARGLAELRRVARRVVVLTHEPDMAGGFWLVEDYFPEIAALDQARFPPVAAVASLLGGAQVLPLPIPHDCADGFLGAYWQRPEAYLDARVRAGMSALAQMHEDMLTARLRRLAADLRTGVWERRHGRLRRLEALDLGYRLIVADGHSPAGNSQRL